MFLNLSSIQCTCLTTFWYVFSARTLVYSNCLLCSVLPNKLSMNNSYMYWYICRSTQVVIAFSFRHQTNFFALTFWIASITSTVLIMPIFSSLNHNIPCPCLLRRHRIKILKYRRKPSRSWNWWFVIWIGFHVLSWSLSACFLKTRGKI